MFGVLKEPSDQKCPIIRKKKRKQHLLPKPYKLNGSRLCSSHAFPVKTGYYCFSPIKVNYQVFLGSNLRKFYRPTTSSKREAEEFLDNLAPRAKREAKELRSTYRFEQSERFESFDRLFTRCSKSSKRQKCSPPRG